MGKKKGTVPHSELVRFGELLEPGEAMEPILAKAVRSALLEWLTEFWEQKALEAVKLKPRTRAIFSGPPGVGKTTLAHHLSARLGLTMLAVRPEQLIDKYLGATARNIGALFDMVRQLEEPVMLFFDEFDAVAGQRRQAQHGAEDERNAYVNTLLQCFDRHHGFLIAATNFPEQIDQAIWRRFQLQIALQMPGQSERRRILARYLDPYGLPRDELDLLAEAVSGASPALIREAVENVKRQLIIGPKVKWAMTKDAVLERMLTTIKPHPDLGLPRLWNLGTKDFAVERLSWPLGLAQDLPPKESEGESAAPSAANSEGGAA